MKKILICSVFALTACAATTDTGLIRLNEEPKDCEFLYTIETSFADYNMNNAYSFLEQKISEQRTIGDTYYIEKQDTFENIDAIFGPKNTYKFIIVKNKKVVEIRLFYFILGFIFFICFCIIPI